LQIPDSQQKRNRDKGRKSETKRGSNLHSSVGFSQQSFQDRILTPRIFEDGLDRVQARFAD